jgi:hypothetical protein
MKGDEIGGTCRTHAKDEKFIKNFSCKPESTDLVGDLL